MTEVIDHVYEPGEEVYLAETRRLSQAVRYGTHLTHASTPLIVHRVQHEGWLRVRANGTSNLLMVHSDWLQPPGSVRHLGEVPEGGIAIDDPRIAWIWEDAAKLAERKGYCKAYDELCDELGIPGRVREFSVTVELSSGIKISSKIKARSRRLAEAKLRDELGHVS